MDDAARAALITSHLDLPKRAARIVFARVRDHVEFDELTALGNLGLTEAAERFDPAAGVPFRAFAWYRVQGAILDGMRRNSNLPRRVWARLTALTAAAQYLESAGARADAARAAGDAPSTADRLRDVQAALAAIRTMYVVSIDTVAEEQLPTDDARPDGAITREQRRQRVRAAITALPARERELVEAHYVGGQSLQDAGAAMGLSKSWASRLHARAIELLRRRLDET